MISPPFFLKKSRAVRGDGTADRLSPPCREGGKSVWGKKDRKGEDCRLFFPPFLHSLSFPKLTLEREGFALAATFGEAEHFYGSF